jgi:plasmid stabilization system protein ParE
MASTVVWTHRARRDLRNLYRYIAQDDATAAERQRLQILEKADALIGHPEMGRIVPERNDPRIREIFHNPYRIVYRYRVESEWVEVLRVWHAARGEPQIAI